MRKNTLYGWLMWLVAAVFYALDYFQHTAPSVLIEPIAKSLHQNIVSVGDVMAIYFPIYAISQLPAGYLLDRFGVKLVLSIACLVVSAGLLCMMGGTEALLILGRALIAVGSAFAFLGALKTASGWLSQAVFPIAVGLTNTIGVLGGMLGQPFLNALILGYGWQHAVLSIGIFGVVLALLIALLLKPSPSQVRMPIRRTDFSMLKDWRIWVLALYAGIMVGTVVNAFSELYDVVFLQNVFHVASEKAALVSSMVFVGIAIGGPSHGVIARWFKQRKTWMVSACVLTIISFGCIVLAALLHWNVNLMFIFYFLAGFFVSSMLLSFAAARRCYPEASHGMVFALVNMVIGICGFIFQFVLGQVITAFNWDVGFLILLVPLLISLALCSFYQPRQCPET